MKTQEKRSTTKKLGRPPKAKTVPEQTMDEDLEETSPYASPILGAVHGFMAAAHAIGAISDEKMKEFDDAALTPVQEMGPDDIKALRESVDFTQAVLARVLNVSLSAVRQWEQGEKRPSGTALKLLSLAKAKGIAAIM